MVQSAAVPLDHSFRCCSEIRSIKVAATWRGSVPQPLHKFDVPVVMEVARVHSFVRNKLLVPAGVVVVRGVERLVQVTDKVQ